MRHSYKMNPSVENGLAEHVDVLPGNRRAVGNRVEKRLSTGGILSLLQLLLVQGLVEFLEYLPGIDEGLDPGPFNNLLFVTLPERAINEIVIERPVFVRMLQVQSAGFDPALNVQEDQGLVEGDPESPVLGYLRLFLRVKKGDRRRFVDSTILFFEMLDGIQ